MAYKQRWLEFFEVLDANHNGVIDVGDVIPAAIYAKALGKPADSADVQAVVASGQEFLTTFIKAFDANKDTKVTRDELLAGVEKNFVGTTVDTAPAWWKASAATAFAGIDTNKNGDLSFAEVKANITSVHPGTSDADIQAAYDWAKGLGGGKLGAEAFFAVLHVWATSPNPEPYAVTLTPTFHR